MIFSINLHIQREFQLLGSRFISKLSFRDAWIFVGQRGIVGKSPIEEVVFCVYLHWTDLYNRNHQLLNGLGQLFLLMNYCLSSLLRQYRCCPRRSWVNQSEGDNRL